MSDTEKPRAKVDLRIGNIRFAGEGDQDWLDRQISQWLQTAISNPTTPTADPDPSDSASTTAEPNPNESLASYLRAKGGDTKQVQRFLATAAWLAKRGTKPLTTAVVTRALQENQQKRLGNPADCLNKNVQKGYCEKTSDGFFITPEGWNALDDRQ